MGNKLTSKITSVVLSATTAIWLSGSAMILPIAHAQTVADLQAQIQALLSQIATLQTQLAGLSGGAAPASACNFTNSLTIGSRGSDVKCLQQYLNSAGHKVAASGPGAPGSETDYFGSLTQAAVAKWQAANGVAPAVGYFGPISRAKYTSLTAGAPAPAPAPVAGTAAGLTVTLAPDQPSSRLFPEDSASVPFTKLLFTASSDGNAVVDSVTVERTGSANNAAFNGIILLDESGIRVGTAKTLGSDNKVVLTEDFTVKAGQTRALTLAGDGALEQDAYTGQLASLSVVNVQAKSGTAVNASYPMTGATHTVNSSLAIGTLTLTRGTFDPGNGATKEVGTQGYIFSGLRMTAGSAEDVLVKALKFNQSGSAGSGDLGNVKVVLDGVTYDTTLSEDGKYYSAMFGSGVKIEKGFNKDVHIKADVLSGSNRTVDFDLYRFTDLQAKGLSFGYDLLPTAATTTADNDDDGEFQDAEPEWDAFQAHIGAGTIQVAASTKLPAQNIAENLADQPLGAFDVTVKGEVVSVGRIVFRVARWNGSGAAASTQDVTGITLSDASGKIVAGPVDIASGGPTVTFTDTVTFPVGTGTYTLKGKLHTDFANNDTLSASTTPSSDWTTVKGQVTNTTISPTPSTAITATTMTVKAAALEISTSPTPVAQTIIAGTKGFTFAKYTLDATASGEDLRVTQMQPELEDMGQANSADDLTSCQLWDGGTALNTGGNIVNPTNAQADGQDYTVNFDLGLIVPRGTIKTLEWKCDTVATTTTTLSNYTFQWEIQGAAANAVITGITSGQDVTETYNDTSGQVITLSNAGTLSVALDAGNPPLKVAQSGSVDNTMALLRFTANNENINVTQIALNLSQTSSNTPQDLAKVTLWDGITKVGETVMTGDYATVTLSGFVVPKDSDKVLTIKGDLATIGTSEAARPGHRVVIDYDGPAGDSAGNATRGVGLSSGSTIYATPRTDTASNGVLMWKAVPTLAKLALPSTKLVNATIPLYRFSVSAPAGTNGVGLYKFTFTVSTSTQGVTTFAITSLQVRGYSDSAFSTAAYDNNGLLNSTTQGTVNEGTNLYGIYFDPTTQDGVDAAIQVPAGATRYFELIGTVANLSATSSSATVQLEGDAGVAVNLDNSDNWVGTNAGTYGFATTAAQVDGIFGNDDDFIWSGNSTTTVGVAHYDWTNGYRLPGLPGTNMTSEVLSP